MKYKLKIITLLTLSTLSAVVLAQAPNQPAPVAPQTNVVTTSGTKIEVPAQNSTNDYSNIGEGNSYEKAVTPLLREISRKKSILELKKLDKEIAKLDEVDKKEVNPGFVPIPTPQPPQTMRTTSAVASMDDVVATPVKVLMTYGDDNDLYAKIAVGEQGGYTVRKGDILPDGRTVVKVNSNFIEVQKAVVNKRSSKSKTEKIFVSAGVSSTPASAGGLGGAGGTTTNGTSFTQMPTSNIPTLMPIPAMNQANASNVSGK